LRELLTICLETNKKFRLLGTVSRRHTTGASPLDPTGRLPSPRPFWRGVPLTGLYHKYHPAYETRSRRHILWSSAVYGPDCRRYFNWTVKKYAAVPLDCLPGVRIPYVKLL